MPGHGPRLDALYASLVLNIPTLPAGNGNSGSVNFIVMDRFTAWLHDPSRENELRCLEVLAEFRDEGHNTLRKKDDEKTGEPTYACEQAVPGMHGEYLFAAVAGAMLRAKPSSELFSAAREYVLDELALCLAFRFWRPDRGDDGVYIPAPRVKEAGHGSKKGETSEQTGKSAMLPRDGYRDVRLALVLGEQVRKRGDEYWKDPQSIGVWCMRELVRHKPLGTIEQVRQHPVPHLFAPITRVSLASGGFLAYLEDTPTVRRNTIDVCNWVVVRPRTDKGNGRAPIPHRVAYRRKQGGSVEVVAGYDWQPLPDVETVPGSEVTYGK